MFFEIKGRGNILFTRITYQTKAHCSYFTNISFLTWHKLVASLYGTANEMNASLHEKLHINLYCNIISRNRKNKWFLKRETALMRLNNILIESPYCIDYKDIFFSLAQTRVSFYGPSNKRERALQTCNCIIIIFAQSEKQVIFVKRNGSYLLE